MLMYGYWQHKFGGDRAIVGQTIKVDGKPTQVIGVMPREFHFLNQDEPSLLIPSSLIVPRHSWEISVI